MSAPIPGASAKAKLRGKLRMMNHRLVFNAFLVVAFTGIAFAQSDWNEPFPPHRIADNLYYVGSKGLSTYLITTDVGHILINSSFERCCLLSSSAGGTRFRIGFAPLRKSVP